MKSKVKLTKTSRSRSGTITNPPPALETVFPYVVPCCKPSLPILKGQQVGKTTAVSPAFWYILHRTDIFFIVLSIFVSSALHRWNFANVQIKCRSVETPKTTPNHHQKPPANPACPVSNQSLPKHTFNIAKNTHKQYQYDELAHNVLETITCA